MQMKHLMCFRYKGGGQVLLISVEDHDRETMPDGGGEDSADGYPWDCKVCRLASAFEKVDFLNEVIGAGG